MERLETSWIANWALKDAVMLALANGVTKIFQILGCPIVSVTRALLRCDIKAEVHPRELALHRKGAVLG